MWSVITLSCILSFVTWDCVSTGNYCIFRSQQYERDSDGIAPLGEGYNEIDNFSLRKAGEKVIFHLQEQTLYYLGCVEVCWKAGYSG